MRAAELLGADGPLARALPGYELREAQLRMATLVEEALEHEGIALIEAGTGTGKTLAYLVPALRSGKKVVVSTGTRTLQDQIMEHDLPLLSAHLGMPVKAACMKGLANYVCRRRYRELLVSPDTAEPALARRLPMLMDWVARTEHGDRAELADLAEDEPIWAAVASSSETRIGPRCKHFDECFVTAMRRRAEEAQLVIVNHHLFFADLDARAARRRGAARSRRGDLRRGPPGRGRRDALLRRVGLGDAAREARAGSRSHLRRARPLGARERADRALARSSQLLLQTGIF